MTQTIARPVPKAQTQPPAASAVPSSDSHAQRFRDNRRYQRALVISLTVLGALVVFGFFVLR